MKLVAYGYNLRKENYPIIQQMARLITQDPIDIYDLRSYEAVSEEDKIAFFFGQNRTVQAAREKNYKIKIDFPDVDRLDKAFGDEEERQQAYEKLLKLKEALDTDTPVEESVETRQVNDINEENLPDLTSQQILQQLEAAMAEKGVGAWNGVTKDGLKVRLTIQPEQGTADINITFAELYFVKAVQEALQVKELQLVPKPGFNWESSPLRSS